MRPELGDLKEKYMNHKKTKSEIRDEKKRKLKTKQKKGGTLASQILKTKTANNYQGDIKKFVIKK